MKKKLVFTGPVLTASGYGVHARQLLAAIVATDQFDVYVESLRWGETPFLSGNEFDWIRKLAARPVPPSIDVHVHVSIPNEFKRRAPLEIGVTAGIEVDRVSPQWLVKCNAEVDVVVVPSEHSRQAFMVQYQGQNDQVLRLERPCFAIAEGVDTSVYRPDPDLSPILDELGVPPKNFVFTGLGLDKPQGRDRKNASRLVEYFCKAFAGNQNVGLVLKLSIVNGSTVDFELVKRRITDIKTSCGVGEFPRIFLVHGRVSDEAMAKIYNDGRVIAAISLTHGEGFGLPLIEAAACGLPVVATDWSGHLDFLTKNGKKLFVPVEYDLQEVFPESVWEGVIDAGTRWAVVRESDAIIKMQKMVMSSATPRRWAEELAQHIAQHYDQKATGKAFADLVIKACAELDLHRGSQGSNGLTKIKDEVRAKGPSLIYTMPMSAGDVFLSTGVVKALRRKHPGHRVYFATSPQYFDILKDLRADGKLLIDEIVTWQPWMQDVGTLEDIFDEVYTPNLAVQMTWSNWVHKGKGRNLIDEFATQCGVEADRPVVGWHGSPDETTDQWVAVHAGGQKSARAYAHWTELVKNIRAQGIKVRQVGSKDDISIGEVDEDLRGQTNHGQLCSRLISSDVFLGIDSYPMHVAAAVGTRVIALFGSSYPSATGPKPLEVTDLDLVVDKGERKRHALTLIETPSRNGCDRACYKDVCKVDATNPCINNIGPAGVFSSVMHAFGKTGVEYKEHRPKIAGYTHILNPKTHGYPFLESINSMLGFCDEVIVVDGKSADGSVEDIQDVLAFAIAKGQLKIIEREWDPEEPGMDGMQKAFGRAMVSPDMEFLWQQDADEIVHEEDYAKIVDVCKRFPADVDLVHLPVVELWGDDRTARTDRHSWKWRLSRNNLRVTHGINAKARQMDPNTGRIYAKPGMSDGCEYIDIVTGEHLPHRGFYTADLEGIRQTDPTRYGEIMNEVYEKLPSVWHYSWADLPRKVRNFRDFWDNQWQVLYQSPPQPRFPDVKTDDDVMRVAAELKARGGEHGPAPTFKLRKAAPAIMRREE